MERRTRDGRRLLWRQWTESEARATLDELAASEESLAHFARRKGVSPQRLAYWRKRLARARPAAPAFVSVALPVAMSPVGGAQIELVARGITVRVREDLESEKLAGIVEVLVRALASC
jgi:hypothetical protein